MNTKKVSVIMLPTGNPGKPCIIKSDETDDIGIIESFSLADIEKSFTPQCLYFCSDEEIKEGDWCLQGSTIYQYTGKGKDITDWDKILASTNSQLFSLPGIPEEWIRGVFIPSNGSIKEIEISTFQVPFENMRSVIWKERLELVNNEVVIAEPRLPGGTKVLDVENLADFVRKDREETKISSIIDNYLEGHSNAEEALIKLKQMAVKSETVEEAAKNYALLNYRNPNASNFQIKIDAFMAGIEWLTEYKKLNK